LRPELAASFETLATLLDAEMRGLVLMALAEADIATHTTQARPFGAEPPRDWSLPALGLGAIAAAFLEPDPQAHWDEGRVASTRQALSSLTPGQPAAPPSDQRPTAG
jgi:hypothetical protein